MTIEEAIPKAAEALKKGIHKNWVTLALLTDGIPSNRVDTVVLWAQQINIKEAEHERNRNQA